MKNIKTYLIIIGLIVCIGKIKVVVADEELISNNEKPKMIFEKALYDFGKIYIGESVEFKFKFKNLGQGELIINNVKTSCGCTAALISKNKLLRNEEGEVDVKFNSGKYLGSVTKTVVVNSNDPENPKYKLTITGEIIEEVSVNPKRINFGVGRRGDSSTKALEIKTVPELKIGVTKVESASPYITITNKTTEENSYSYLVTFNKYEYIGKYNGIIFIYTSSNKQERIDIPFSGEVIGDITYYPEIVSFGNIKKSQDIKRTIIVNMMNSDVRIDRIETEPSFINFSISELNNSSKRIDVKFGNVSAVGKITGSLKIYTNSVIQPIINIPINGEIKE